MTEERQRGPAQAPEPAEGPVKTKIIKTVLDDLPAGDEKNDYGAGEKVTNALPEGVTSRALYRDVVRIAWPSAVELLLTQLASMVDLMMVGQLGPWAITSVGLSTQPRFLFMMVFVAMNVGVTAMVARYRGSNQREKAQDILRQGLLLNFITSVVVSVAGYFCAGPMVAFMGAADAQTLAGGTAYTQVQMLGMVVNALTVTITAGLRGVGDSRTAMVYNLTANVVNVIFNYFLIGGNWGFPRLEVLGASLATVLGQVVAMILAFAAILKKNQYLRLELKKGFRPDRQALGNIATIGFPAMLEQAVMRLGMILYARTVASLGTVDFAVHQICLNIQGLSFMNGQAFAVSATSLVGQSLGKKRPDMAQAYSRRTRRIGLTISVLMGLSFVFFGGFFVSLYNADPYIIQKGGELLLIVAAIQPLQSSQFILAGALRGAGDTKAIAVFMFITVLLVRPGLATLLVSCGMGLWGAWIALAADQALRSFLVLLRYNSGKWKKIKIND